MHHSQYQHPPKHPHPHLPTPRSDGKVVAVAPPVVPTGRVHHVFGGDGGDGGGSGSGGALLPAASAAAAFRAAHLYGGRLRRNAPAGAGGTVPGRRKGGRGITADNFASRTR